MWGRSAEQHCPLALLHIHRLSLLRGEEVQVLEKERRDRERSGGGGIEKARERVTGRVGRERQREFRFINKPG